MQESTFCPDTDSCGRRVPFRAPPPVRHDQLHAHFVSFRLGGFEQYISQFNIAKGDVTPAGKHDSPTLVRVLPCRVSSMLATLLPQFTVRASQLKQGEATGLCHPRRLFQLVQARGSEANSL